MNIGPNIFVLQMRRLSHGDITHNLPKFTSLDSGTARVGSQAV